MADIPRIAALHAASWRVAYRGILSDRFLDGPIDDERLAMWRERCAGDPARWPLILVAEDVTAGGTNVALAGFLCAFIRDDPRWGTMIDNVHVAPGRTGQGIGGRLLSAAATVLVDEAGDAPVYLWVYAENSGARAVYERLGGRPADRHVVRAADGSNVLAIRYTWDSPAALLRA